MFKVLVHILNERTFNTVLYTVYTFQIYFHDRSSSIFTQVHRKSDSLPLLPGSLPSWSSNPAWISVIDGSLRISPLAATEGCDFNSCLATRCMSSAVTFSEKKRIYITTGSRTYLHIVFSTGNKSVENFHTKISRRQILRTFGSHVNHTSPFNSYNSCDWKFVCVTLVWI